MAVATLEFRILTPEDGDRLVTFDPNDPTQVQQARLKFQDLLGAGYRAYRSRRGQPADRVTEFDPLSGEILFTGKHGFVGG